MVWTWEGDRSGIPPPLEGYPQKFRMSFPTAVGMQEFPVEGCRGQEATRTALRVHFFHIHVRYTMVVLEKGNLLHPRCLRFDMLVPWKALNFRHTNTAQCYKGANQKRCRLEDEDVTVRMMRAFQSY